MRSPRRSDLLVFGLALTAAAVTGAAVSTALLTIPNMLYAWTLASLSPAIGSVAVAAKACAGMFLAFAASTAIASLANDRLPPRGRDLRFIVLFTAVSFLTALMFEVGWHISGGGGNLSASNPEGMTVEDGHITALGWVTAARRATVASGIGLAMSAVYVGVRRLGAGQRR